MRPMKNIAVSNAWQFFHTVSKDPGPSRWVELEVFLLDEDQPYDGHTNMLIKSSFRKAFGTPFNWNGMEGIILLYA